MAEVDNKRGDDKIQHVNKSVYKNTALLNPIKSDWFKLFKNCNWKHNHPFPIVNKKVIQNPTLEQSVSQAHGHYYYSYSVWKLVYDAVNGFITLIFVNTVGLYWNLLMEFSYLANSGTVDCPLSVLNEQWPDKKFIKW